MLDTLTPSSVGMVLRRFPVLTSHREIPPSLYPEAIVIASVEMAREEGSPTVRNDFTTPPVWISHRLTPLSSLPDTINVPSDEKMRDVTRRG